MHLLVLGSEIVLTHLTCSSLYKITSSTVGFVILTSVCRGRFAFMLISELAALCYNCDGVKTFFLRQRHWPRLTYLDVRRTKTFRIWLRLRHGENVCDLRRC